jgi:hypothetical protein
MSMAAQRSRGAMSGFIYRFLKDDGAATAIEYSVIPERKSAEFAELVVFLCAAALAIASTIAAIAIGTDGIAIRIAAAGRFASI